MRPAEIAFVVDHSGSMCRENADFEQKSCPWFKLKTWFEKAIDAYKIDGIARKGGLVVWSARVLKHETITFQENKTAADLKAAIHKLPMPRGGTAAGRALKYTYDRFF